MNDNNNIPRHWKLVSLVKDLQFIKTGVSEYKGKKKYYSTGSIKEDKISSEGEYDFKNKPSRANRVAKLGDVFQARMKNTDKAILINNEFDEQLFSTGFIQIRGDDKLVFNKYIFYYLTSNVFKQQKDKLCSGSTQSALNDESAKKIVVPIPPFKEQQDIVAKIEDLLSESENAKQQLLTAQQQLKVYRQSLLKWAFEKNNYHIFNMVDLNIKIQIGPFGTQLHKEDYIENGIPLINPMHIQNGKIIPNYSYSIRNEKMQSLPNYILKEGDVIMGRRGEMGRCGLVTKTENGWFCGTGSLYFRPNPIKLNSRYLYYYLSSQPIKKYLELNAGGTTMANLNLKIVKEIPIKLPEIGEQIQVVNELESKLTVCDKIEETISQSLQQTETLRQSILKKAFEGNLVTTVVVEQRGAKVIPLYKPRSEYFYQMQLLGLIAKASKQKQIEHGEMTLAKYAYLMDKVYDIPTYYEYNRWHLGPYPPTIKKAINNKQYFRKSGNHIEVLNEKTLFNSTNPYTEKIQSAVNDLSDIFSKYTANERSHKTELLATVCKVIEDIQTTDLKAVRQSMQEWKIDLKGEKHKTKAEKFSELETEKCLAFIKEKGWDKKLIK
jgi:type I restriction enzyme, S subunit